MSAPTCSICFEDLFYYESPSHQSRSQRGPERGEGESHSDENSAQVNSSQSLSAAPCGHVFHTGCVSQWARERRHCPQCRRPVEAEGGLVRLFLAASEDDNGEASAVDVDEKKKSEPTAVEKSKENGRFKEKFLEKQREAEDGRIIQDVLQCQLEDLDNEVRDLRKALSVTEDHLGEKVKEASWLECELSECRRRRAEAEAHCRGAEGLLQEVEEERRRCLEAARSEFRATAKKQQEAAEKENEQMRRKVAELQRESSAREAEAREKAARLQEAQGIIRRMELELQTRPDLIHVQNSTDIYSIYESVDEISANVSSLSASSTETAAAAATQQQQRLQQVSAVDLQVKSKTRQQQRQQQQYRRRRRQIEQEKQRRKDRNFCSCARAALAIAIGVVAFLALFVVLPLKIIFTPT